jgi:hypothetical protein
MSVRISATDWLDDEGGLTAADSVLVARALRERGLDVLDVSSAGNSPRSKPVYGRMYQVPLADRIRHEVGGGLAVMAVGAIQGRDHVNTILAAGRADLCALARPHLVDPHVVLGASAAYDYVAQPWPKQYLRPSPSRSSTGAAGTPRPPTRPPQPPLRCGEPPTRAGDGLASSERRARVTPRGVLSTMRPDSSGAAATTVQLFHSVEGMDGCGTRVRALT